MDQEATFDEARKICAQDFPGARLMAIKSRDTADLLNDFVQQHEYCWLGATDRDEEQDFKLIDGYGNYEDLTYTNWKEGQPNNYGGNEDCSRA